MFILKRKATEEIIKHLEENPDEQTDKTFVDLCKNGELKTAKWLFDNRDIDLTFNNSQCIRDSARENRLDVIEWLYPKTNWLIKVDEIFDDENEYESLLCYCCRCGYFSPTKYLYEIESEEFITENNDEAFGLCCQGGFIKIAAWIIITNPSTDILDGGYNLLLACTFGHLKIAQWLHRYMRLEPGWETLFRENFYNCFERSCSNNHLSTAKWLLKVMPSIDIRRACDSVFRVVCINGHLPILQWILSIKPKTDMSCVDYDGEEGPFRSACEYGHLHVAQWLYSKKPTIDISINNEYAFSARCVIMGI